MDKALEITSVIDTLYETTEVQSCVVVVDGNILKGLLQTILAAKLYPPLDFKLSIISVDEFENDDNARNAVIAAQIVITSSKTLVGKYGFGLLDTQNTSQLRHAFVVV
jgi:hypothetical protein